MCHLRRTFLWAVQIIVHRKSFTEAHWHLFNTLTCCSTGRLSARTQHELLTSYISKLKALGDNLVQLPGYRRCPVLQDAVECSIARV